MNTLDTFLNSSARQPLLTAEEEAQLAARIARGDRRAKDRLVEANLRLVMSLARQYQGQGLEIDDLVSEGSMALVQAADKYDASRGTRFAPFATVLIRRQLEKVTARENAALQGDDGRAAVRVRSVDAPLAHRSGLSLLSVLVGSEGDSLPHDRRTETAIECALLSLSPRETQVVNAFFGLGREPLILSEIAEEMGLKRERIRQIRNRAVRRMKKVFRQQFRQS